jgi:hypothetical protein
VAAGNITILKLLATIEADENVYKAVLGQGQRGGGVFNAGAEVVYLRVDMDAFLATGLQADGEIPLAAGESLPLPIDATYFRYRCGAGLASVLHYSAGVQ